MTTLEPHLGDFTLPTESFKEAEVVITAIEKGQSKHRAFVEICKQLYALIDQSPKKSFLLPAVVDFLDRVNHAKLLNDQLTLAHFEFWLNHFSGLSEEENRSVRTKIVGKIIPRDAYQAFFPIGMGKRFNGTHFVASHLSPDTDTMIAGFWGWVDAFAARVGTGVHFWNLPGGAPKSPMTTLFKELVGSASLDIIPRTINSLTLTASDLVTNQNVSRKRGGINISQLDHGINERAIIMVDEEGHFIGDWRSSDVEPVRQVIILFKALLRWFETNLQSELISFFATEKLTSKEIEPLLDRCFNHPINTCQMVKEFSDVQYNHLELFFTKVLEISEGLKANFSELNKKLHEHEVPSLLNLQKKLKTLQSDSLFNSRGELEENRPQIFHYLEKITSQLNDAIYEVRSFAERLDVSMQIKEKVLNIPSLTIKMEADVEVIRQKIESYHYLTVTIPEENGKQYPVGVVWAKDLRQTILGTVSFRDFCNFDEVKMAPYLSVISVIDHHKAVLRTDTPPLAIIGDAQACNVLVAEQEMRINDQFSLLGLSKEALLEKLQKSKASSTRLMERHMRRKLALEFADNYFIHPQREYLEYLCFLHAILDDTDLLTKVTARDVICTADLLNRMKSLQLQEDVELINLDDIPENEQFAKEAAKRILRNHDMYSIYKKSFDYREREVEENLNFTIEGKPSNTFSDVKTQNRCCRVSQTKLFSSNFPLYEANRKVICSKWTAEALSIYTLNHEIDLHLHMISTIASAEEVYQGKLETIDHLDELWFWTPETDLGLNRLANFLNNFRESPEMKGNKLSLEILNPAVEDIFKRYFLPIEDVKVEAQSGNSPAAILRFKAGSLNSRKAMISPYLPKPAT